MASITQRGKATSLKDARRNLIRPGRFKAVVTDTYVFDLDHRYGAAKVYKQHVSLEAQETPLFEIDGCRLTVYPGYLTDYASGWTIDTDNCKAPAIMHDAAYQLLRMRKLPFLGLKTPVLLRKERWGRYRQWADKDFERLLEEEGMCWIRRKMWYAALRVGGAGAATPKGGI